jgi:hypothetical protein
VRHGWDAGVSGRTRRVIREMLRLACPPAPSAAAFTATARRDGTGIEFLSRHTRADAGMGGRALSRGTMRG